MEALVYEQLKNKAVRCKIYSHYCFIQPGKRGVCGVKENQQGKLVAINYGKIIAEHIDPIEKKAVISFPTL